MSGYLTRKIDYDAVPCRQNVALPLPKIGVPPLLIIERRHVAAVENGTMLISSY